MKRSQKITGSSFLIVGTSCLLLIALSGCKVKQEKPVESLGYKELKERTTVALKENNQHNAVVCLAHLVAHHSDKPDTPLHKLLLADLYFKDKHYAESFELYSSFYEFYPQDPKTEYARYKAILSKYHQTLSFDRDSTATEETIKLCKEYQDIPDYVTYQNDVEAIKKTCNQKLIDKEVYIYNFYIRSGKFQSAQGRLKDLRNKYLTQEADLEPRLLYLESKLAKQQKKYDQAQEKLSTLIEKYPQSEYVAMAQNYLAKKPLAA